MKATFDTVEQAQSSSSYQSPHSKFSASQQQSAQQRCIVGYNNIIHDAVEMLSPCAHIGQAAKNKHQHHSI